MAEDIKRNLFCSSVDSEQFDALDESCYQLEAALDRMEKVCWGSAIDEEPRDNLSLGRREVGDESGKKRGDDRFDHSWFPRAQKPGPGWIWIPKGCITLEKHYPARLEDIRKFGYAARKIRAHPKPPPLTKSFAQAVFERKGMANRENQRLQGKRR
jgi:hypothetical protein